jgi:hypothetical protein
MQRVTPIRPQAWLTIDNCNQHHTLQIRRCLHKSRHITTGGYAVLLSIVDIV